MNDTLEGVLDDSDDEAATESVVGQVLDEIGIEITGKVITETYVFPGMLLVMHTGADLPWFNVN